MGRKETEKAITDSRSDRVTRGGLGRQAAGRWL